MNLRIIEVEDSIYELDEECISKKNNEQESRKERTGEKSKGNLVKKYR